MILTYSALHDLHSCTMATSTSLTSTQDRGLKMYRFDLQKAVTGTINAVSSNSGQDLIGKIIHLKKLFSGQPVQVREHLTVHTCSWGLLTKIHECQFCTTFRAVNL